MISAYYDCTSDSHTLFDRFIIAKNPGYENYINGYNVISLDMAAIISETLEQNGSIADIPKNLSEAIRKELIDYCPSIRNQDNLASCFIECVELTGREFIFIIDEWDAVIREAKDEPDTQRIYLKLLHSWFKNNNFTPKVVAAAYMTGILPIKKDGSQSAISDFREYTILNPGPFTEYSGFTEM